jgi:hypothetical protein
MAMRWLATLLLLLLGLPEARAWNGRGHMLVAAVAYERLDPAVRRRVAALLRRNPSYPQWVQGVSAAERTRTAFLRAATWADAIKGAPGYTNDSLQQSGADAARNIGYADHLQHRYWHYVDLPFSTDGAPLVPPEEPNAATQIARLRDALRPASGLPAGTRSYDLVWLLHLVGDVHQPLHATSRFTEGQPEGDRGGNEVALCAAPCRDNLHSVWDGVLGKGESPSAVVSAAAALPRADAQDAANADVQRWVEESSHLAQTAVYAPPIGPGAGPFMLDAAYRQQARGLAERQVALAGARLANLLNSALR